MAIKLHAITIIDETTTFSLQELSQTCNVHAEWIIELVEQGLLEPKGKSPEKWLFPAKALDQSRVALRLKNDLGVNLAGIGLAFELLEQIDALQTKLKLLEHQLQKL